MNARLATTFSTAIILMLAGAACDETPQAPLVLPPPEPATQPAPEPERPTTQALLDGPRKRLSLEVLPLSLEVPESWQLQRIGGSTVLTGPAPSSDVTIHLTTRSIGTEIIPLAEKGAMDEAKQNPQANPLAAGRSVNGIKIFERQSVGTAPLDDGTPTYRWIISAYGNGDKETSPVYELSFFMLTKGDFEKDRAFLYSIVDSMQWAGTP
ncbi:MAG TPA: hypothetical protein VGN72_10300 [Tepidisphaeraceae bacterium]|jgi:hypothetical protein|nr:hypothetical protein [Tepidisphaeraceae bacterium]